MIKPAAKPIFIPTPPPAVAYELKTCEWCARHFTRQIGTQEKYCRQCSAQLNAAMEPEPEKPRRAPKKHLTRKLELVWKNPSPRQIDSTVEELKRAWGLC